MPDGLYNVLQFFANNGIKATIILNQPTGRISIRSDQIIVLVFAALFGYSSTYKFIANTTHTAH